MAQRVDEQISPVSAVKAKLHFFEVGGEMLRGNSMPRSHDAALEQAESGFDGIGVNVTHDVDPAAVFDDFLFSRCGFSHSHFVRSGIIGENDFHIFADILANVLRQCSSLCVSCVKEAEIAVALADADDNFLVVHLADLSFAAIPATDVGRVHFHFAVEHRFGGLRHGVPDAMAEVPCCFVRADAERALNLAGRNSFLRFAEKQRCGKPSCERQVRIIEHGACCDGELVVTVFAVEEVLFGFELNDGSLAAKAARSLWKAQAGEQFAALGVSREHGVHVN